jgi:plasmid stability protein
MPVNLSVKDVPDDLAAALRERARLNHRSLQGELMAILQAVTQSRPEGRSAVHEATRPWGGEPFPDAHDWRLDARKGRVVWGPGESTIIVRQTRDEREFTIAELHEYLQKLPFETPAESTRWIRQNRDRT